MSKEYYKIRNYCRADFDNYLQLHMEVNRLDQSGRLISKQRLAEELGHPNFHPEKDLFVAERGSRIIGYAGGFLEAALNRVILECMIHPHHRKNGIATELIGRTLGHAEAADIKVAQVYIAEENLPGKRLALRLGFNFIRHFYGLKLNLNDIQLPDIEPSEYVIRSLEPDEADKLTYIQNRTFAAAWGFNPNTLDEIAYRINLSSCSPGNVIMVYLKHQPIGYCWTRIFADEGLAADGVTGEIHMLGVDPDYRGKGIGRDVLLAGLADLKSKGVSTVELTADGEEPVALCLYESVGFERCSRNEWYEKKLTLNHHF
ncbi:MAG: GNAT family N-acetyltransferase [Desulfobacterales bacterium]|jgi:mycothiol synthase